MEKGSLHKREVKYTKLKKKHRTDKIRSKDKRNKKANIKQIIKNIKRVVIK
jgi:hypothetical protein